MKRIQLLLLIPLALLLGGCPVTDDLVDPFWDTSFSPILAKRSDLEQSITFTQAREVKNPGKIYFREGYLFLNEKYEGVHIIDNRNPENPIKLGFLKIPGSIDMAANGNYLYVDNAVDLVTIDLSDQNNPQVVSRKKNVFPELTPPDLNFIPSRFSAENRPDNTIIIGWERRN